MRNADVLLLLGKELSDWNLGVKEWRESPLFFSAAIRSGLCLTELGGRGGDSELSWFKYHRLLSLLQNFHNFLE